VSASDQGFALNDGRADKRYARMQKSTFSQADTMPICENQKTKKKDKPVDKPAEPIHAIHA
jgi:hypothetical protein